MSYPAIAPSDLGSVHITLPPLPEQRAIVAFLDRETARIDALLAANRRMAELLAERLRAQFDRLIDPGQQRYGNLVLPIRRVLRKEQRAVNELGIVTAFRDGRVMSRRRRREEGFTESSAQSGYQGVHKGDVVFHGLDGFAGAVGVSEDNGICSPVYHVCSALPGFDPEYIAFVLRALALSGYLELQSGNVRERAVDFRNWNALGRIPVPITSLEHQQELATAIRLQRMRVDRLTDAIFRQTELLQEQRQSLITAAVTGHLDVSREAA